MYHTYHSKKNIAFCPHGVFCIIPTTNSDNPRQHERVGITVGTQCVLCEVKGKVQLQTGNEGPDGSRGIALLLL